MTAANMDFIAHFAALCAVYYHHYPYFTHQMGDFSAHFHRPESGIHTVEGNVAGSRAASLTKKRQLEQEQFEAKKRQIEADYGNASTGIHDKFAGESTHQAEQSFKSKTVGLVTAKEFKKLAREKQNESKDTHEEQGKAQLTAEQLALEEKKAKKLKRKKLKEKKKLMSTLSFAGDQEEEALVMQDDIESSSSTTKKKANLKDPTVDTSFLPDRQREEDYKEERRRLEQEWKQKQEEMKQQELEIVYSYWDIEGRFDPKRETELVPFANKFASLL